MVLRGVVAAHSIDAWGVIHQKYNLSGPETALMDLALVVSPGKMKHHRERITKIHESGCRVDALSRDRG